MILFDILIPLAILSVGIHSYLSLSRSYWESRLDAIFGPRRAEPKPSPPPPSPDDKKLDAERPSGSSSCNGQDDNNVMLLFAHPDDECMFFGPTLYWLSQRKDINLTVLCLSSGNADNLGKERTLELLKSLAVYGVPAASVIIVDDPALPDDNNRVWNAALVAKTIETVVRAGAIQTIFTFDRQGVSGHQNHISTYMGAKHFGQTGLYAKFHPVRVFALESVSIVRKYTGVVDAVFTAAAFAGRRSSLLFVADVASARQARRAMQCHDTQLVWYRYLSLYFSRYMYMNSFVAIAP